ncbi:MAG: DNA topoisomerase I, partial [Nanoarchaeota archaeon]
MRQKPKKTREEKSVEGYFPIDETSVKHSTEKPVEKEISRDDFLRGTTEKPVKQSELIEKVEKASKKKTIRKKATKTNSRKPKTTTIKQEKQISIPKNLLKKDSYELIITEKPQAAEKISAALGVSTKRNLNGIPYYEVDRKGKSIVVACAVGHLFTLKQNNIGSEVPTFDISWVPNFQVRKQDFSKKYYEVLKTLAKNAGEITVATDFDIEGEVIGINVVKFICDKPDANRMKFSTLTNKELDQAYENKSKHIHWGQAIAGEARHYLDWYYGINLSRALMNAIKTTGKFKIMSIGRVQGPTLKLIVDKEREISKFKPETYWQVFITVRGAPDKSETKDPKVELKYIKDIFDKNELKQFENLIGKKAQAQTKKTQQELSPNPPFNLTTLQTEAYRLYGITPSNSLKIAQSLYLAGLISYPRTSSQKLPDSIDYKSILEILKSKYKVSRLIKKDKPIEGEKTDPAHPSIYPTGNSQVLSGDEENIYDLIVKRFLCLFCENAVINKKKISAEVNNLTFSANGSAIKKKAWLEIYPSRVKEVDLPDVNGEVTITNQRTEEKQTQPPKRYSPASILSELERKNLGTKSTRSAILETLYDRGYIKEKAIEATTLGISLIETLEKYSPIIINENLTKELQDEMDNIVEADKNKLEGIEDKILNKAKKSIIEIAKQFEKQEKEIGKELTSAQEEQRAIEKKENTLIQCPKCQKGNLAITYSRKNRKQFIACDAYPECKNTFSLPPGGLIKRTDKVCESCGFPMLMSLKKTK